MAPRWLPLLLSIGLGATYGLVARFIFGAKLGGGAGHQTLFGVMTLSFLFVVPGVIGVLYAVSRPPPPLLTWGEAMRGAAGTALVAVLATMALSLEGSICVVMATPVFLIVAALGGLLGWFIRRARAGRASRNAVMCFASVLPFLAAPFESRLPEATERRVVQNEIRIHAAPAAVWEQIRSVPLIDKRELPFSVAHLIGLPRPLEATLSHDGIGGVRNATFERGLAFKEVVTQWEPGRALAFSIHADTVPAGALDDHVAVGGPYFDVLDGAYRIEPLPGGDVLLHLESQQRLSMRFNGYAGMWTSFIMSDLQQAILVVIAHRSERSAR